MPLRPSARESTGMHLTPPWPHDLRLGLQACMGAAAASSNAQQAAHPSMEQRMAASAVAQHAHGQHDQRACHSPLPGTAGLGVTAAFSHQGAADLEGPEQEASTQLPARWDVRPLQSSTPCHEAEAQVRFHRLCTQHQRTGHLCGTSAASRVLPGLAGAKDSGAQLQTGSPDAPARRRCLAAAAQHQVLEPCGCSL